MTPIKYNLNALKIINDLSSISKTKDGNTPIKFVKDLEGVHVRSGNSAKTIVFAVDLPSESFDIPNPTLSFYDYSEFYKYVTTFPDATLSFGLVNEGSEREFEGIIITKDRKKISYQTSDDETISGSMKSLKHPDPTTSFNFNSENFVQLKKIINLFHSDDVLIKLKFSGKFVDISIKAENIETLYEDQFELDIEIEKEFEIVIRHEVFKHLLNTNYVVEASEEYQCLFFNFVFESITGSILVTGE